MNTPTHAIVNLVILGKGESDKFNLAIIIGSLLPDLPMFWFYFWVKFVEKLPSSQIWKEAYFEPFWQNIFDIPNSIILCLIGVAISHWLQKPFWKIMFISMIIHCIFDFFVHNDDAHRHFLPLTNYRFISPFSYWDPRHHGKLVALGELILLIGSSLYLYPNYSSWWIKISLLGFSTLYLIFYLQFYIL